MDQHGASQDQTKGKNTKIQEQGRAERQRSDSEPKTSSTICPAGGSRMTQPVQKRQRQTDQEGATVEKKTNATKAENKEKIAKGRTTNGTT